VTFDDMLIHVLPWAPGCPSTMAIIQLRNAAREWCQETEVWLDTLPDVMTEAGRAKYALNLEKHQDAARILSVTVGGVEYPVLQSSRAKMEMRRERQRLDCFAWTTNADDINLFPVPTTSGVRIQVECSLMPSESADEVADEAVGQYRESVAAGALARLLSMLKEEWANPSEATRFDGRFRADMKSAGRSASDGFKKPKLRVIPA